MDADFAAAGKCGEKEREVNRYNDYARRLNKSAGME